MVDFDLREWLLILGPIFVAAVLVHGYFRMRSGHNDIKMKLDKSFMSQPGEDPNVDDLGMLKAELPNGGARVLNAEELALQAAQDEAQEVPVLVEEIDLPGDEVPVLDLDTPMDEPGQISEPEPESAQESEAPGAETRPEKFVVINVLSLDEPFAGQPLVEILVESGMTFGEMDIFHHLDDGGNPQFSLASAVEPGTFNMATVDSFSTPGVTMFMRVHELADPVAVLDNLLHVAGRIANELNGEVCDETRSVMTSQTIEHCRQSIRDFQFKHSA